MTMRSDSSSDTSRSRAWESGSKATFIGQARRAQIIRAAVRVLVANGYQATSLAKIAAEAGVAKGVVSYHFTNKEELLEQVVIDAYVRGAEEMVPKIEAAPDMTAKLRAYLEGNLQFLDENREHLVALVEVILNLRRPDGTLRFSEDGNLAVVQPLADLLRAGQEAGEFTDFDPLAVAYLLRDAIDGITSRLRADREFDIVGFGRQLINFTERAVLRSPSDSNRPSTSDTEGS